ncbi:sulfatase-like hydrolase/transferase [Prosthecobacter dejongeii]|uniref:Arylsulfatase A-like enzyme n=1 Tax=Prosthecobacter dejongeii TaxID=48465 RepID=A0A7W8DS77_9BACT|nr:arylsulfatase A-like enzyme [Prosthecobacter dejongeii]
MKSLLFFCLLLLCGLASAAPPNVLFLFADDMRSDSLGALGDPVVKTPNLDGLVQRGFIFTNAYNLGGNSPAVCMPSRNMMMSGRAYTRWKDYLPVGAPEARRGKMSPGDGPNFPLSMKDAGYETWHFGKKGNSANLIQAKFDHVHYLEQDHMDRQHGEPGREIIDGAIQFVSQRSDTKPFFMYLGFSNPHDPRVAAQSYRDLYVEAQMPLPRNYLPVHPFDNGEMMVRDEMISPWPRSQIEIRRTWRDYYATITGLDAQIGRLMKVLQERGLMENTLILFSADQGIAIGSHGLLGKQNLYDHSAKAPLVVAGPGIPKGKSAALVHLLDIYPTVCDLVGANQPAGIDGISFKPVILGKNKTMREALLLTYMDKQRGLRDVRYKLIRYPQTGVTQLFDLESDPLEMQDLSLQPELQERKQTMLKKMAELQAKLGDDLPLEVAHPRSPSWKIPTPDEIKILSSKWKMEASHGHRAGGPPPFPVQKH